MDGRKVLLDNINEIHTTELGKERIRKNLNIIENDVVEYCIGLVNNHESYIYKQGKNWYVKIDGVTLTINSYNYCIITAHKDKNK